VRRVDELSQSVAGGAAGDPESIRGPRSPELTPLTCDSSFFFVTRAPSQFPTQPSRPNSSIRGGPWSW